MWDPSTKSQYNPNGSFNSTSFHSNSNDNSNSYYPSSSSGRSNGSNYSGGGNNSKLVSDLFDVERSAYGSQWTKKSETLEYFALQSKYPSLNLASKHTPTSNNNAQSSAQQKENDALYDFILSMNCPVIMVISSVGGRDDFHHAAERCLPSH
eukprot:gene32671-40313_t